MRVCLKAAILLVAVSGVSSARAEENILAFDDAVTLAKLETTGAVSIDSAQKHQGAGSLKLEPGAKAVLKLRPTDGTGKVELWVYEDGASPANPKTHAAGAMWGLMQADGHMVTVGAVYAPYLSGNTTYAAAAFNPDKQQRPWQEVQYLGIRRKKGWHQWTFDFGADNGLHILLDGQDINARHERFNWNKSRLDGFTSIVLFGDKAHSDQVLWVDDVQVTLGPPTAKKTLWPPPPPTPPADLTVLPNQVDQSSTPYSRWKNGPSPSTDYFPIAVWLQDPKLAEKYKAAGFNLYIGLWKGPTEQQLDMLRKARMSVICAQNELALKHLDDKIIVGWLHGDEPDNAHRFDQYWKKDKQRIKEAWPDIWKSQRWDKNAYRGYGPPVPPAWIVRDYQEIRDKDPSRPVMVNLGQGVAWEQYRGRGERTGHLEDYP